MSPLLVEMDRVIAGVAGLNRQSAFAALEAVFGGLKARYEVLSEAEITEFVELVHLVLLQFARGMTIRVSGPRQPRELDVCLRYNDIYEAALHRAMEFLSRNLFDHLEKYSPREYLRAALRVMGKEYYHVITDACRTVSIPDESALREDDPGETVPERHDETTSGCGYVCSEEALSTVGPGDRDFTAHPHDGAGGQAVELQMFQNWYEGNLSRLELTRLYRMTMERVEQALLRVARTYEGGSHYGMVKWLIEMGEDGDIIWLLSKDMTAADVGLKVQRNQWVVYKHRDAVRRRLAAFRSAGNDGRAFCTWLLGLQTGSFGAEHVPQLARGRVTKKGLVELEGQVP